MSGPVLLWAPSQTSFSVVGDFNDEPAENGFESFDEGDCIDIWVLDRSLDGSSIDSFEAVSLEPPDVPEAVLPELPSRRPGETSAGCVMRFSCDSSRVLVGVPSFLRMLGRSREGKCLRELNPRLRLGLLPSLIWPRAIRAADVGVASREPVELLIIPAEFAIVLSGTMWAL